MRIAAGARLGPYEIVAPLGAGGMGVVYKARDGRLDRLVALKTIAADTARTAEALQRFEREARAISSLSHPHICAVYDVGNADGIDYLVMELLEGETLAARIARGPLPVDALLQIGVEIAEALAAAHARGIVHRDLKPGNVMLTSSGVKLLDFGLAKTVPQVTPGDAGDASTAEMPAALTERGTILGTAAYMAPEQIQGQPATARSDVFALGAVLHEMATGRRVFAGNTSVAIAAAILHQDPPPIVSARADIPPAFDRLVRACLVKDPAARWQTAHDATMLLADIADDRRRPPAVETRRRERMSWLPWLVAAASVVLVGVMWLRPSSEAPPPFDFQLDPPPDTAYLQNVEGLTFALSPKGDRLAFIAGNQIWIRPLGELDAKPMRGTAGARSLFWSPDGNSLAWFDKSVLKRLDVESGNATRLCELEVDGYTGTWSNTGTILFGSVQGDSIRSVSENGGAVSTVVTADPAKKESHLNFPWFLPDGQRFLYSARLEDGTNRLMLGETGVPARELWTVDSNVQFVKPSTVVYVVNSTLVTQAINLATGKPVGAPVSIAQPVNFFLSTGRATFATSLDGTLVYQIQRDRDHLAWVNRTTRKETEVSGSTPAHYLGLRLASEGHIAMLTRSSPATGTLDIWLLDLKRGTPMNLTETERKTEIWPLLLPDQTTVVYGQAVPGPPQLMRKTIGTNRDDPLLARSTRFRSAYDVTPDGRLVYGEGAGLDTNKDLWTWPLAGTSSAEPLRTSLGSDVRLSPDGRYFTFTREETSEESKRPEVYWMPLAGGGALPVSAGGGSRARWNPDGKEILYLSLSGNAVVRVPVLHRSPTLVLGPRETLLEINGKGWADFDIAPDGRLLAIVKDVVNGQEPLTARLHAMPGPASKR